MSNVRRPRRPRRLSRRNMHRLMRPEPLESRLLLASDWQNSLAPLDVNHDQHVTSGDVLSTVNFLNKHGARVLAERSEAEAGGRPASVDVNGDGAASASDALSVINYLNGEGEDEAFLQYRIAIFDSTGTTEIETIGLGEEFVVRVFVQDIRMTTRFGVFSAYLDIEYESALASVVPDAFMQLDRTTFETVSVTIMDNQDDFGNGREGDATTPGLIDGAGSFSGSLSPTGPAERELLKFKVKADAVGTVTFVGSPTTEAVGDEGQSPLRDAGLFLQDPPVCPTQSTQVACMGEMMFISDSISIVMDIVAAGDSVTVNEDSGSSDPIDVLSNDSANVGTVILDSFTQPASGEVVRNSDDTFSYTPGPNFFGDDSFSYMVNNGAGATSGATVSITVNPINDGPVNTVPGSQTIDEDNSLVFSGGSISVSDVDADAGSGLEVMLSVSNGSLAVTSSGAAVTGDGSGVVTITGSVADVNAALTGLTYAPNQDFNGSDSLSINTSDQGNFGADGPLSDADTVSVTITPVNDAPMAADDSATTDENAVVIVSPLTNDSDPDGDTLSISTFTQGSNGTVADNGNGTLSYTPNSGYSGNDSFTYTVSDGNGGTDTATVDVTVNPVNDAPVASNDSATTNEDTAVIVSPLTNDTDADGDTLTVSTFTQGTNGSVTDSGNGTLTYTPSDDYNGSDSFNYTVSDGNGETDTAAVSITINPINDAPVNVVPGPQTVFNTEVLSFNNREIQVEDVDAETLEVTLTVSMGTLSLGSTSSVQVWGDNSPSLIAIGTVSAINTALNGLTYDPTDGFVGSDSLAITSSDLGGTGAGGPMTDMDSLTLTVTPPEVPFAAADLFEIEEDSAAANLDVLSNDLPPDPVGGVPNVLTITQLNGQTVTAGLQQTTANGGTLTFNGSTFDYLPASDFFGTDTFTYTIESSPEVGDGPSTANVVIDIHSINDGPVNTVPGSLSIAEDSTLSIANGSSISVEDIDAGADGVTVTLTVSNGTLGVSSTGGGTVTENTGGNTVTLSGTVIQVNGRLGGLTYTPIENFSGLDTLTITTDDNGNTGGLTGDPTASNPLSDIDTVEITIQPVNDPPTIVVPGAQSFIADFDNLFSATNGNAFIISDVDAGENDVQVDLTIGDGSLTISDTSGLSVTGNGTTSVTVMGTVDEINSALAGGMTYRSAAPGDKTLSATVNDLGNTGGGGLSDTGDVPIEVLAFVPSTVGGFVFIDSNDNGMRDLSGGVMEGGLEGVRVSFSGVDAITGKELETMTVTTAADGSYQFMNLRPGTYTFGKDALPHFITGAANFESPVVAATDNRGMVDIGLAGGVSSLGNYFPVRGLNGTFFDGLNHQTPFLAPDGELFDNLLFAIDASDSGSPTTVVSYQGRWAGYDNARIVLAADGKSALVTVREMSTGADMSTTVTFESARLRVRSMGARTTVRVFLSPAMFAEAEAAAPFADNVDAILAS
jgi:hypothetical protein